MTCLMTRKTSEVPKNEHPFLTNAPSLPYNWSYRYQFISTFVIG